MSFKKVHRKDKVYYNKPRTIVQTGATPVNTDTDTPAPEPINNYRDLIAGEDLSSWKHEPIMIGTDGKAYKANSILTNWNRVIGILSTENTNGNAVRVQTNGKYYSSSYNWSASDIGDPLVVRTSGISNDVLVATYGSEVMHIHIANVIDDNTIELLEKPTYMMFL